MWSPNNPISHHTSHTMGNGASSSSGGSILGDRTHPIGHHTSHTMGNGACSSSSGAREGNECSNSDADNQSGVVETTITGATARLALINENTNTSTDGSGESDETAASSPCSEVDSVASSSDGSTKEPFSGATSLASSGNLFNFAIIDSTLREGEQFATAHFTTEQKLEIARALDDFGVEYIEVTSPAASEQSRLDCAAICKLGLKAKVLCHIRCNMDDARIAVETGVDGINMCIGTSANLMKHSHGKDMAYIAATASEIIAYVKAQNIEIRFSGEDSFRSDFTEILKLYTLMDQLGANRVGIADTVGGASPWEVYEKISALRNAVGCDIETHFHNDTGCAVANAFVALEAGATHVDTTVLGIGERNGITSLGGLMAALVPSGRDFILNKYRVEKLAKLERLVAEIVEIEIPFNNFVVSG